MTSARFNVGADRNTTPAAKAPPAIVFPCRATCYSGSWGLSFWSRLTCAIHFPSRFFLFGSECTSRHLSNTSDEYRCLSRNMGCTFGGKSQIHQTSNGPRTGIQTRADSDTLKNRCCSDTQSLQIKYRDISHEAPTIAILKGVISIRTAATRYNVAAQPTPKAIGWSGLLKGYIRT